MGNVHAAVLSCHRSTCELLSREGFTQLRLASESAHRQQVQEQQIYHLAASLVLALRDGYAYKPTLLNTLGRDVFSGDEAWPIEAETDLYIRMSIEVVRSYSTLFATTPDRSRLALQEVANGPLLILEGIYSRDDVKCLGEDHHFEFDTPDGPIERGVQFRVFNPDLLEQTILNKWVPLLESLGQAVQSGAAAPPAEIQNAINPMFGASPWVAYLAALFRPPGFQRDESIIRCESHCGLYLATFDGQASFHYDEGVQLRP